MQRVEIRVKGQLDEHWSDWFDHLTVTHTDQNETMLTGSIVDQAALYGLIAKLRDLGAASLGGELCRAGCSSQKLNSGIKEDVCHEREQSSNK